MTVAANAVKAALVVWVALLLPVRPAMAQAWVGVEATHDRAVWHFDNASAFDTADLVPHFFEQDHTLDNVWLTGGVSYRAGADWQTTLGITPTRQARATDYDTFFNPGANVIDVTPIFVATFAEAPAVTINDEHLAYRWVSFEEAEDLLAYPGQRQALSEIKRDFALREPPAFRLLKK